MPAPDNLALVPGWLARLILQVISLDCREPFRDPWLVIQQCGGLEEVPEINLLLPSSRLFQSFEKILCSTSGITTTREWWVLPTT